ncbi:MAG: 30S ribosomal protein S27e [Nanoarchaeota archaeon]
MLNMDKNKKSKFLKISCPKCRNRLIVFGKASMSIKCNKCNYLLIQTKGGKARIRAPIKEVLS